MNVKEVRKSLGLNQEDFAKLLGVVRRTISRWENEQNAIKAVMPEQIELLRPRQERVEFTPEKIKQIRENLGWTQKEMAKRVGVVAYTIIAWELGRAKPNWKSTQKLLKFAKERCENGEDL